MPNSSAFKLLIATNNPEKVREFRALLGHVAWISLVSPADLGLQIEVAEVGNSYAANAALKANAFAQASGLICLADDSGLEVHALDGAPGLYSARYSPKPGATNSDRRAYLLENLAAKPRPWQARFRAVIAITTPDGKAQFAEGSCEGELIPDERGSGGFGYDSIFLVAGSDKTMAELSPEEKNQVSHRARALSASMPILRELFDE